jgi:hypothetical protein
MPAIPVMGGHGLWRSRASGFVSFRNELQIPSEVDMFVKRCVLPPALSSALGTVKLCRDRTPRLPL